MRIVLLGPAQAHGMLRQHIGSEPDSREGIADLVRHEVSARGRCPRHFLIARVCRAAAPGVLLDAEIVGDVCDELEREGDLLLAEGGVLHPAPVRIVALGSGDFRFICAVPSIQLLAVVRGQWSLRGGRRICRFSQAIEPIAVALGAAVITPEVWAGFDRVPSADAEWVGGLDARLAWAPEPAGSLEHDGPLDWTALDLSQSEPRWRSQGFGKLWRARHPFRRWVYAWTPEAPPSKVPFLSMYPDEGARTVYAMARMNGGSLRGSVSPQGDSARVVVPGWLPLAEYRYLSTCAERIEARSGRSVWGVPATRRQAVLATLEARLGLMFDEEPA